MTEQKYRAYELVKHGTLFIVFVPIKNHVHVSHWYGYDYFNVTVFPVSVARKIWRDLVKSGAVRIDKRMFVGPKYMGLDAGSLS